MKEPYYILIAFIAGFTVAQVARFIVILLAKENRGRKWSAKELWWALTCSGGTPSGHATSMSAATTVALAGTWANGFDFGGSSATALFILLCVDLVVFYDATHVRFAVGEQGKALNKVLEKNGQPTIEVVEGHTLRQVIAGIITGVTVGTLTLLIAAALGAPMPWA